MKVEITHDILAGKIYDRIGAEDKMRLKMHEFIQDRYLYFQEANVLLSSKDLQYISPYLERLTIDPEHRTFIEKSQLEASRRESRRRATILTVIGVLTAISILSFISWQSAIQANERAVQLLISESGKNIYQLEYDSAWKKIQVARGLGLNDLVADDHVRKQVLEMAYFHNETGSFKKQMVKELFAAIAPDLDTAALGKAAIQDQLRKKLQAIDPEWITELDRRTGPAGTAVNTMEYLDGGMLTENGRSVFIDAFEMASTEVTVWQYALYCEHQQLPDSNSIRSTTPGWGLEQDNPVVNVSWYDAARFVNWVNAQHGIKDAVYIFSRPHPKIIHVEKNDSIPGAFRLPTDAEWSYAVRYQGGDTSIFYPRHTLSLEDQKEFLKTNLYHQGWYDGSGTSRAMPVAGKEPNKAGIYDLGGNVWEWCSEDGSNKSITIRKTAQLAPDELDVLIGNMTPKIIRGGSYSYIDQITRTGHRQDFFPIFEVDAVGFRLVRNPK